MQGTREYVVDYIHEMHGTNYKICAFGKSELPPMEKLMNTNLSYLTNLAPSLPSPHNHISRQN